MEVASKCLQLLQAMAKGNAYVQQWIFDHLSAFLFDVTISGPQCAATLSEVMCHVSDTHNNVLFKRRL